MLAPDVAAVAINADLLHEDIALAVQRDGSRG
jgi:hypothetical protein